MCYRKTYEKFLIFRRFRIFYTGDHLIPNLIDLFDFQRKLIFSELNRIAYIRRRGERVYNLFHSIHSFLYQSFLLSFFRYFSLLVIVKCSYNWNTWWYKFFKFSTILYFSFGYWIQFLEQQFCTLWRYCGGLLHKSQYHFYRIKIIILRIGY